MLDRDKSQISRYIRQEGWPFSRRAPWARSDVPRMLRWMADNLEPARNQPGDEIAHGGEDTASLRKRKTKEEIRKLHHQANAAELEYEKARGNVVGVDEMKRLLVRVAGVYVSNLQGFSASLAPILEGKSASEIQDELEKAVGQVVANVRRGLGGLSEDVAGANETTQEDTPEPMGGEEPDDAGGSDGGTGPVPE